MFEQLNQTPTLDKKKPRKSKKKKSQPELTEYSFIADE